MVLLNFDRNKKTKMRVASAFVNKHEPAKQNSNEPAKQNSNETAKQNSNEPEKSQSLEEKVKE